MLAALIISMLFNGLFIAAIIIIAVIALRFYRFTALYEDNINKCLDILDLTYGRVGMLLDRPLLVDTPEVRQIMGELRNAQDAILHVANEISKTTDDKEESRQEESP